MKNLKTAIETCFEKRQTVLPSNLYETMKSYDYEYAKHAWKKVFAAPEKEVSFDSCLESVLQSLKKLNL